MDPETILVIIMGIVVITTWIAASSKTGLYMFSLSSQLEQEARKYRERPEKRKPFRVYMGIALILNLVVARVITQDFGWILFFTIVNMAFITNFLRYFVLLERVDEAND